MSSVNANSSGVTRANGASTTSAATVSGAVTTATGPQNNRGTAFTPPPPPKDASGKALPTTRVKIGGLGGVQNNAGTITPMAARDVAFDGYTLDGAAAAPRGFIRPSASAIPGGLRLQVESGHRTKNDKISLFLVAEVLDVKSNQVRPITLAVLAKSEVLNPGSFRGNRYFDISYDELNQFLAARNPNLKVTPGVTRLAVAARWDSGHNAGGFSRGGVFRTPTFGAIKAPALVPGARPSDDTDLPLDMQVDYPAPLRAAIPKLQKDGAILSRLESEFKGAAKKQAMTRAITRMYEMAAKVAAGDESDVQAILGKDWTIETVNRYWLKDDGAADQPDNQAGSGFFKGFRVDADGLPIQDPMRDTYMDDANMAMTQKEGAIRLRENKTATVINVKPGGGRRDDKTGIAQRVEVGLQLESGSTAGDAANVLRSLSTNSTWSATPFNHAQREVQKLDRSLQLQNALQPWLNVVQDRHKFTVKNKKTGVEVEFSFDKVTAETVRPNLANPDGSPRKAEFFVLEAELDHLQVNSNNASTFAAGNNPQVATFTTDAQQDTWLKATSPEVTMDLAPRLHELEDLENESFRKTGSYQEFEVAIDQLIPELFPRGLEHGRQKAAHAAELMGLVHFSDKSILKAVETLVTESGYKWTAALKKLADTAIADPQKKTVLQQNLVNGTQLNLALFLRRSVGVTVLEYDLEVTKKRLDGRLNELGYDLTPEISAMIDTLTTQKMPPSNFEQQLTAMGNHQDDQVMSQFARALGVNPPPVPKPVIKKMLGPSTTSGQLLRTHLTAINCDAAQAAEVEAFFVKAQKGGATVFQIRRAIAAFTRNPEHQMQQIATAGKIAGTEPVLRASVAHLLTLSAARFQQQYLKGDAKLESFFAVLAKNSSRSEAINWVSGINNTAETYLAAKAKVLGVAAPKLLPDFDRIDAFLQPTIQQVSIKYTDELKAFMHDMFEAGGNVTQLRGVIAQLANTLDFKTALKSQNVLLMGATTLPTVEIDPAAVEARALFATQSYVGLLDPVKLKKWAKAMIAHGLTPAQIQNHATWSLSHGKAYADQNTPGSPQGFPEVPIDVDAAVRYWQGRWGINWTPAHEVYVKKALPEMLKKGQAGIGNIWNAGWATIWQRLAQHSGVARPTGV